MNAGTWKKSSDAAPWMEKEEGWGPKRVSSVCSKLKHRLWNAAGDSKRRIRRLTEDEVKRVQFNLEVPQTGQLDEATLQRLSAVDVLNELWTPRGITKAQAARVKTDRGIDISNLVLK